MNHIEAYPLNWPSGWKKTSYRKPSKFKTSFAIARDQLFHELKLMGVQNTFHQKRIVLSTNVPLRRDGLPLAGQSNPKDPGVAVYFRYKEKDMVFACDTYLKVEENLYAITKTIEAIRGIQRWGASDMMERSFTGFEALPAPAQSVKKEWWDVLCVRRDSSHEVIRAAYLRLAKDNHPDRGGNEARMAELNKAYEQARGIS